MVEVEWWRSSSGEAVVGEQWWGSSGGRAVVEKQLWRSSGGGAMMEERCWGSDTRQLAAPTLHFQLVWNDCAAGARACWQTFREPSVSKNFKIFFFGPIIITILMRCTEMIFLSNNRVFQFLIQCILI